MGHSGLDDLWDISFEGLIEPRYERIKKRKNIKERYGIEQKKRTLGFSLGTAYSGPLKIESRIDRMSKRPLPTSPFRVLDAPSILNDYYLNLLDWSKDNLISLGLSEQLYLWNASNKSVSHVVDAPDDHHISSVSFSQEGLLAYGMSDGRASVLDVVAGKPVCSLPGRGVRVASISWGNKIVSTGGRDGNIFNYDIRSAEHVSSFLHHTQEVCGLKWDADGVYLASGANDNNVCVWRSGYDRPRLKLTDHTAAVRAVGWCPWKKGILSTGGGTSDRTIRTWDVDKGICLNSTDSGSQVCSIVFSERYKELITTHGFSDNTVSVWKYCSMRKVGNMNGHTGRVLFSAMSPDGEVLATCGADENLNFWNLFDNKAAKRESVLDTIAFR
ncbi:cell division cycle 20, cofactor of APC complex [Nematocida sp. ERTm5]|nr:cell division cycle 20, cofactor of APC complex [Nematocida sp. AWRm79]KAI5183959.1 cell division cycle 20, cofactor of APC complex [Nematocida sp. AWRm78]OAG32220.1 cell division cycle 20, cofactor of APC complex [Nematocida sp. ERTm5]